MRIGNVIGTKSLASEPFALQTMNKAIERSVLARLGEQSWTGFGERNIVVAIRGGLMPYSVNADLPPSVRHHLPEHAQDIYREAFNHAYAAHVNDPRQEEAAHRIAWAAVKRSYVKSGNNWVEKSDPI